MANYDADHARMQLYDQGCHRLYVNAAERERFLAAAKSRPAKEATFALTLLYTGCRISEALALTTASVQPERRTITFRTLKRRHSYLFREVPIPPELIERLQALQELDRQPPRWLWGQGGEPVHRATAYRWIKAIMKAADIAGSQACPKGLRHGYGIHALQAGVQLNMLQKWMGHADMTTTAIYANAIGADELKIADRMWG